MIRSNDERLERQIRFYLRFDSIFFFLVAAPDS